MKIRIYTILIGIFTIFTLSGCGTDPELTKFKNEIDAFVLRFQKLIHPLIMWMPNQNMLFQNYLVT